jgi:hypothetical protein
VREGAATVKLADAIATALEDPRNRDRSRCGQSMPRLWTRTGNRGNAPKVTREDEAFALRCYLDRDSIPEIRRKMGNRFSYYSIRNHINWYKVPGEMILDMERVNRLLELHPVVLHGGRCV